MCQYKQTRKVKMSYQEKRVAVSLISALIVFALYAFYMFGLYQDGRFDGPGASSLVGKSSFVLIGVSIVASIVVQIAFTIIHAIVTREYERSMTDERDRLIELRAMKITLIAFSVGYLASMGVLAFEILLPYMVFLLILISMFVANVLGDIAKLFLYRRGF